MGESLPLKKKNESPREDNSLTHQTSPSQKIQGIKMKQNFADFSSSSSTAPSVGQKIYLRSSLSSESPHRPSIHPPPPPPCAIPQCQQYSCLFTAKAFNVPSDQLLIGPLARMTGTSVASVGRAREIRHDLLARKCEQSQA